MLLPKSLASCVKSVTWAPRNTAFLLIAFLPARSPYIILAGLYPARLSTVARDPIFLNFSVSFSLHPILLQAWHDMA